MAYLSTDLFPLAPGAVDVPSGVRGSRAPFIYQPYEPDVETKLSPQSAEIAFYLERIQNQRKVAAETRADQTSNTQIPNRLQQEDEIFLMMAVAATIN